MFDLRLALGRRRNRAWLSTLGDPANGAALENPGGTWTGTNIGAWTGFDQQGLYTIARLSAPCRISCVVGSISAARFEISLFDMDPTTNPANLPEGALAGPISAEVTTANKRMWADGGTWGDYTASTGALNVGDTLTLTMPVNRIPEITVNGSAPHVFAGSARADVPYWGVIAFNEAGPIIRNPLFVAL